MASFLPTDDEDKKQEGQSPLLQATAQQGNLSASGQPGEQAVAPKQNGFVGIGAYEKANQGAGSQLGNQVSTGIQNKINAGTSELGKEVSDYANRAGTMVRNSDPFAGKTINGLTQQDKDMFQDYAGTTDYSRGLQDFTSASGRNNLANAVNYANSTDTTGGQKQALMGLAQGQGVRGYSSGENKLDTGLLGRSAEGQAVLKSARDAATAQQAQALQQAQSQTLSAKQKVIDSARSAAETSRHWLEDQQQQARNAIDLAVQNDRASKEAQIQAAGDAINPGKVEGEAYTVGGPQAGNAGVQRLKNSNPDALRYTAGLDRTRDADLLNRIAALDQLAGSTGLKQTTNYAPIGTNVDQSQLDNLQNQLRGMQPKVSAPPGEGNAATELGQGLGDIITNVLGKPAAEGARWAKAIQRNSRVASSLMPYVGDTASGVNNYVNDMTNPDVLDPLKANPYEAQREILAPAASRAISDIGNESDRAANKLGLKKKKKK